MTVGTPLIPDESYHPLPAPSAPGPPIQPLKKEEEEMEKSL